MWHDAYVDATFKKEEPVFLLYQHFINPIIVKKWIELNPGLTLFLIHLSDENCKSNVLIYNNIAIKKVFRNYWRPEVVGPKVMHIPLGYVKYEALECGAIPIFSLDDKNSYANILKGPAEPPLYGCYGTNWQIVKELGQSDTVIENKCSEVKKWWIEYKVYLKELIRASLKIV